MYEWANRESWSAQVGILKEQFRDKFQQGKMPITTKLISTKKYGLYFFDKQLTNKSKLTSESHVKVRNYNDMAFVLLKSKKYNTL